MTDREDRIRERAYQLWETEGRPDGKADDHWHTASGEIEGQAGDDQTGLPQRRERRSSEQQMSEVEGDPAAGRAGSADPRV